MDDAIALTERLPRTLAGLAGGWMSLRAAQTMVVETAQVSADRVEAVETLVLNALSRPVMEEVDPRELVGERDVFDVRVLPVLDAALAEELSSVATPARIRTLARRAVKDVDVAALRERRRRALQDRDVRIWPAEPGTSWVGALVADADASATYNKIDSDARMRMRGLEGDDRTLAQMRADTFVDSILTRQPAGSADPLPVPINLTIQIDPGGQLTLDHLGQVGSETLQHLLDLAARSGSGSAKVRALPAVTCPGTHDHPGPRFAGAALAAAVVARDRTCRFPGCAVPAIDCDLDHAIPHPHGPTCICNLLCLCRRHHRTKTFAPDWRVIHHGNGHLTWITPTGKSIRSSPDIRGPSP